MAQTDHHKIVLLESDQNRRDYLKSLIAGWGYRPFIFESRSICLDNLLPLDPDLVISGSMAADKTLNFIQSLKLIKQNLPMLIFAVDDTVRNYIDTNGFSDIHVLKSNVKPTVIKSAIYRTLDSTQPNGKLAPAPLLIGSSPAMVKVKSLIPKINQCRAPVLIQGEPGSGKELFARAIHSHSKRNAHAFTMINAVKLPYLLLEGELFGYSSDICGLDFLRDGKGLFAAADKGTFFIKEVSAMPVNLQAKLLQVIEDHSYFNGMEQAHTPIDVRIIASTNRSLEQLASAGKFRRDLLYRLNVFCINMPPLRERVEDIPPLADFFSYRFCFEFGRSYFSLSGENKQRLCRYPWPGNVKELADVVRQAVICGSDKCIANLLDQKAADIRPDHQHRRKSDLRDPITPTDLKAFLQKTNDYSLKSVRREFAIRIEKTLVKKALESANWNRKKSAEMLDISYKSLLNKMKSFNFK